MHLRRSFTRNLWFQNLHNRLFLTKIFPKRNQNVKLLRTSGALTAPLPSEENIYVTKCLGTVVFDQSCFIQWFNPKLVFGINCF